MPLVPIRDLGQHGVYTDVDPLDLPLTAFNYAANVRFVDGKITRGHVVAEAGSMTNNDEPMWAYSFLLPTGVIKQFIMDKDGTIGEVVVAAPGSPLTYTNVSKAAYTPSSSTYQFTSTMLSNVVYVNRQDRIPWFFRPTDTVFQGLAGDWDSTWRCKSLRTFNDALVAINITKGATVYPTMVKTSDFTTFGTAVTTWVASASNSATENVLADLDQALVDGFPLRDRFILYSQNQTWLMEATGDSDVYKYQRLFEHYGMIAQNCVVSINNMHYVFGNDDLWMHDGFTTKSIATSKVRKFVFDNLVRAEADRFFVFSTPKSNEVMFFYMSDDPYAAFPIGGAAGYPGCNKAVVYNWQLETWTFYDVPYINGAMTGPLYAGLLYSDAGSVYYDSISATYTGLFDTSRYYNLLVGRGGSVTASVLPLQTTGSWATGKTYLYSYELPEHTVGIGSVDALRNPPSYLENLQMDMDEISKELRGYKVVSSIYPEGRLPQGGSFSFWTGSADYSNQSATWSSVQTFDGNSYYKLDYMNPGRYLSLKMAIGGVPVQWMFTGMDIDFKLIAHR